MPEINLANEPVTIDTGLDSITIVKVVATLPGGGAFDATSFTDKVIKAGHVIVKEDATGILKPHPVTGAAYAATPAGHTVCAVQISSVLTERPLASPLLIGTVNEASCPYPVTAAMKTALKNIVFI